MLLGGFLMGGIVLTIDRVLIAGLQGSGKEVRRAPSLSVALALGAFMAQPALLYLFKRILISS